MDPAPARFRARERMAPALQRAFGLIAPGLRPKENPCPPETVAATKQAFRRFGLL